jgi:hypothetical protein
MESPSRALCGVAEDLAPVTATGEIADFMRGAVAA